MSRVSLLDVKISRGCLESFCLFLWIHIVRLRVAGRKHVSKIMILYDVMYTLIPRCGLRLDLKMLLGVATLGLLL